MKETMITTQPDRAKFECRPLGFALALLLAVPWLVVGCEPAPKPSPSNSGAGTTDKSDSKTTGDTTDSKADTDSKPKSDGGAAASTAGPGELALTGVSFLTPKGWVRVPDDKKSSRIIEAELTLPKVGDDEHDGRLTLMSSGGSFEDNMGRWTGEFKLDDGFEPKVETINIAGRDSKWVDFRGEWKGSSFRPQAPRPDHRMIVVIIPFGGQNYYLKLVGPKPTIAENEEKFREFAKSARIKDTPNP